MGRYQTRLPTIEEERIINASVDAAKQAAANGAITVGGGTSPGGSGPGTLESLTDVSITPLDGDLIFRSGADWVKLAIPTDWATTRYVLGIAAGFPAWVAAADGIVAAGWGFNWGNIWGGA